MKTINKIDMLQKYKYTLMYIQNNANKKKIIAENESKKPKLKSLMNITTSFSAQA